MSGASAVTIKSGDQTRNFAFGVPNQNPPVYTTSIPQASLPIYKESPYSAFQVISAGAATVSIQGSNDDLTGRGYILGNANAPGNPCNTTNGSPTLTAQPGTFIAALVGTSIVGLGIPYGTVVNAVAAGGASLTMSANATITAIGVAVIFYAQNWVATALGTITLAAAGSDGFAIVAPWRYVRANVTAAAAATTVNMAV